MEISTHDRFAALARSHASFGAVFASLAGLSAADSPAAPSFASGTLALVAGVVCVALLLLAVAASLDAAAAPLFRDALAADEDVRLLASLARLKGAAFFVDRALEGDRDAYGSAAAPRPAGGVGLISARAAGGGGVAPLRAAAASAAEAAAPLLFRLPLVASAAHSPAEGLLGRGEPGFAGVAELSPLASAPGGDAAERLRGAILGAGAGRTSASRLWRLRGFLLRLWLLRAFFEHQLLSPFTRFDPYMGRATRFTLVLTVFLSSMWADAALYSFKAGGTGVTIAPAAAVPLGDTVLVALMSVCLQQLVLVVVSALLTGAARINFEARYPFIAAEMRRRKAAKLRFAAMTPAELERELALAAEQAEALRLLALGDGAATGVPLEVDGEGDAEREGEAGGKPSAAAAAAALPAAARAMAPHVASAASSLLLQRPSDAALLDAAAAGLELATAPDADAAKGAESGGASVAVGSDEAASLGAAPQAPAAAPVPKPAPRRRRGGRCCGLCCRARVSPDGPEKAMLAAQARALAAARAAEAEAEFELRRVEEEENWLRTLRGKLATVLMRAQVTTASLAAYFLVALIFTSFLIYMLIFGVVQGGPLLRSFGASWASGQVTSALLLEPGLLLAKLVAFYVLYPAWRARLRSVPLVGAIAAASAGDTDAAGGRKGKKGAASSASKLDNLSMVRAAGLASSLPPDLAVLAYGITAAVSAATASASDSAVLAVSMSEPDKAEAEVAAAAEEAGVDPPAPLSAAALSALERGSFVARVQTAVNIALGSKSAQNIADEVGIVASLQGPKTGVASPGGFVATGGPASVVSGSLDGPETGTLSPGGFVDGADSSAGGDTTGELGGVSEVQDAAAELDAALGGGNADVELGGAGGEGDLDDQGAANASDGNEGGGDDA